MIVCGARDFESGAAVLIVQSGPMWLEWVAVGGLVSRQQMKEFVIFCGLSLLLPLVLIGIAWRRYDKGARTTLSFRP